MPPRFDLFNSGNARFWFQIKLWLRFVELTSDVHVSSFFAQRPRRFAPDKNPGIFIADTRRGLQKIYGKHYFGWRPVGRRG
jgi:hypothetical protein